MTIPIFITARLGSTRLPRKHFLKLGPISVIEHIVRRCEHFGFKPVVCVPQGEEAAFGEHTSGEIFGGNDENVDGRLDECAGYKLVSQFHHLDGDDPFFAEEDIWHSYMQCRNHSTVTPTTYSSSGSARHGTHHNLEYTAKPSRLHLDDENNYPWPQRLTLDYQEDYHLLCAVNRMVGGYMAPRWAVDQLFINNPDLHKINWFRTDEWKERQLAERSGR